MSVIERTTRLDVPVSTAFDWHARPGALERLIPPWEPAEVVERGGGLTDGGYAVLRIRVGPAWVRWVARHRDFIRGEQFVDEQVVGPFARWVHTHRFEPDGDAACRITDRIDYLAPFGPAGVAAQALFVRRKLARMLGYRHHTLAGDLAAHHRVAGRARMHVLVSGASGLIGRALVPFLTTGGHRVTRLVRHPPGPNEIRWDPDAGRLDADGLHDIDAVVHLAGENVGARWTAARKRRIRESRERGTGLIARTLAALPRRPRVLVSASAIGIYGDRDDEALTETSQLPAHPDFLADVAREWEASTAPARNAGIRVVTARLGVVLTPAGGALARMLPPFRLGVGGPLGSGRQWMSWIGIDDVVGAIHHLLMHETLSGAVNVTAPEPARNRDFAATLGRVLHRPAVVPVPAAAIRLAFGEMGRTAVLGSQRVLPAALERERFAFRHPDLHSALAHVLGREE